MNAVEAARANDLARRDCVIRMDRMAHPRWRALSDDVQAEIEAAIPEGTVLSVFGTYLSRHTTFTARLMRGSRVIAQVERAVTVEWGLRRVLAVAGVTV